MTAPMSYKCDRPGCAATTDNPDRDGWGVVTVHCHGEEHHELLCRVHADAIEAALSEAEET